MGGSKQRPVWWHAFWGVVLALAMTGVGFLRSRPSSNGNEGADERRGAAHFVVLVAVAGSGGTAAEVYRLDSEGSLEQVAGKPGGADLVLWVETEGWNEQEDPLAAWRWRQVADLLEAWKGSASLGPVPIRELRIDRPYRLLMECGNGNRIAWNLVGEAERQIEMLGALWPEVESPAWIELMPGRTATVLPVQDDSGNSSGTPEAGTTPAVDRLR